MKPRRFPVFSLPSIGVVGLVTLSSLPASAADRWWDNTGADLLWSPAANWSSSSAVGGANPAAPPGASDVAIFCVTGLTGAKTVRLNGTQSAQGLRTQNQNYITSLEGGGVVSTLNLGASGIAHSSGGLVVGSLTAGQEVNIVLQGSQDWSTTTSFSGGALVINNGVSAQVNSTLKLTGTNTGASALGAPINGPVTDGAGVLSILKDGAGTWALNAANTYTGPTTVSAGRLNINVGNTHGPGLFTVSSTGTLFLKAGGATGFTSDRVNTLFATGSFSAGSHLLIETNGPVFSAVGTGDYRLTKSGTAELALAGINSRTGITDITAGILRVRDLQSGGVPSAIGASSNLGSNLLFTSGTRLIYDGPATTTDRLFTTRGGLTIEAAGSGPLQFINTDVQPQTNTSARTIVLLGANRDDNLIAGALGTRTDTSITKRGNGSWRISGTQPVMAVAGSTTPTNRIDEGKLTFDYSTGINTDPCSPVTLLLNGGTTIFKGRGTATTDTITTLNLGQTIISQFDLKLQNGFALTVNTMTGNQTQRNDLIDLYDPVGNPNNSLTVNALAGTLAPVNGVIMSNGSTNAGRANYVLRAQDGSYGFLALSNGTSGTAQKAAPLTVMPPGSLTMNNATGLFYLGAGDYFATENLVFSTAQLDSTDGQITIDLGNYEMRAGTYGKAILFSGNNDITITGVYDNNSAGEDTALWFHNYLPITSQLNLNVGLGDGNQTTVFGGTGTTEYRGVGFVGTFDVNGGKFRYTTRQDEAVNHETSSQFKIGSGAVLEIGNRMHESTVHPADFIKPVGNGINRAGNSTSVGTIRLYGDAGLSAYTQTPGGKRVACFSSLVEDWMSGEAILTTQQLTWGSNYFLTVSETDNAIDGDNSLMLSSSTANATIEIQNNINLNGRSRTIEVANGSANIDAQLSGSLTGDGATGIVKRGAGTLQLSGVNTYKGETRVMEGTLMIDGATLDEQSRLWIDSGATLHIDPASINANAVHVSSVFIDGIQYFGTITHPRIVGGGTLISDAALTPYAQWVINKALGTAESAPTYDADFDGIRNLVEYAVGSEPKTPNGSVFAITGSAPRQLKFNHPSGRTDIAIYLEASPTLAAPWTTIATSTVGAAFVSNDPANVTVLEVSNQVTVTDSRTPAGTVMFYRLRVEK